MARLVKGLVLRALLGIEGRGGTHAHAGAHAGAQAGEHDSTQARSHASVDGGALSSPKASYTKPCLLGPANLADGGGANEEECGGAALEQEGVGMLVFIESAGRAVIGVLSLLGAAGGACAGRAVMGVLLPLGAANSSGCSAISVLGAPNDGGGSWLLHELIVNGGVGGGAFPLNSPRAVDGVRACAEVVSGVELV